MIEKPEDVDQSAWDAAEIATLGRKYGRMISESQSLRVASVARAILAAVEAEREACAAVLDAAANRQKEAWDEYMNSGGKGPATSFEGIFRGQAAAIRKREEA